mgnify:CR=1 FL=1
MGVFSSYECEEFRNFTLVASELRSLYEFRHTMDASFLPTKSTPLIGSPIIRVFKNFDEGYDDLMVRLLSKSFHRLMMNCLHILVTLCF